MFETIVSFLYFLLTRVPFLLAFGTIAICAFLYWRQEHMIFLPKALDGYETPDQNPEGLRSPSEYDLNYQDVYVTSTDGTRLHTWFIKQSSTDAAEDKPEKGLSSPTIFFFQGNAGNMGFRLPNLVELHRSLRANIVAVSCRGYGFSEGTPSEHGVFADAQAVLDYYYQSMSDQLDKSKFILFGRSLGGAVALRLAHDRPDKVAGVMVENTFYSMEEEILHLMPPFQYARSLLNILLKARFDTGALIGEMKVPVLFISGTDDTLVSPAQLQRLYAECGGPMKWLLRVVGGTHNDTWQLFPRSYYKALGEFISQVFSSKEQWESQRELQIPTKVAIESSATTPGGTTKSVVRAPRFYETLLRQRKSVEQTTAPIS